jgi:hypothetical protein
MPELGTTLERTAREFDVDIREGRFQRWLALVAGLSSVLSGIEVTYERPRDPTSRSRTKRLLCGAAGNTKI